MINGWEVRPCYNSNSEAYAWQTCLSLSSGAYFGMVHCLRVVPGHSNRSLGFWVWGCVRGSPIHHFSLILVRCTGNCIMCVGYSQPGIIHQSRADWRPTKMPHEGMLGVWSTDTDRGWSQTSHIQIQTMHLWGFVNGLKSQKLATWRLCNQSMHDIQVEPGKPGAEVSKKKNYKSKKEFAYRMCTGWPTTAMPKPSFLSERAFSRSMVVMWWPVLMWLVAGGDEVLRLVVRWREVR